MKHIQKHPEPRAISNCKQQNNLTYATLGHTLKQVLKDALMQEQGYLCCYCERSLTSDDSHIDQSLTLNNLDHL